MIFEPNSPPPRTSDARSANTTPETRPVSANEAVVVPRVEQSRDASETESKTTSSARHDGDGNAAGRAHEDRMILVKRSTMSQLSIILTAMSILLAFRSVNEVAVH